jgi:hypothetical protein
VAELTDEQRGSLAEALHGGRHQLTETTCGPQSCTFAEQAPRWADALLHSSVVADMLTAEREGIARALEACAAWYPESVWPEPTEKADPEATRHAAAMARHVYSKVAPRIAREVLTVDCREVP